MSYFIGNLTGVLFSIIVIFFMVSSVIQFFCYFSFVFCHKKNNIKKDCRNISCKYSESCKNNSLYHDN